MISKKNLLAGVFAAALTTGTFSFAAHAEGDKDLTIYKSPYCGCCSQWSDALEDAGFNVTVRDTEDLDTVKRQVGVPENMQSCHTAVVDGYVMEGHVPLEAVKRVLEERPDIKGLSVPGMPMGSLGMGEPDADTNYTVYTLPKATGGQPTVYQQVSGK
ncbi:DUF411 domain-containing protein [Pseudovibrio sp. JE062]|uniref:DUF411 domain-containing protein n=1 Tax=Pseudovibrio sp. JE062 TaxID=439495 RepID=UPI000186C53C|nr:DUF411 domain-containing protein [Pseudovibrio sp. JE062]EEA94792.1 CopG protein [Pseudovibrio sp. JE062]